MPLNLCEIEKISRLLLPAKNNFTNRIFRNHVYVNISDIVKLYYLWSAAYRTKLFVQSQVSLNPLETVRPPSNEGGRQMSCRRIIQPSKGQQPCKH